MIRKRRGPKVTSSAFRFVIHKVNIRETCLSVAIELHAAYASDTVVTQLFIETNRGTRGGKQFTNYVLTNDPC